jgi:hypothetical protein
VRCTSRFCSTWLAVEDVGLAAFVLCAVGVMLASVTDSGRVVAFGMALFFVGIALGTWVGATH